MKLEMVVVSESDQQIIIHDVKGEEPKEFVVRWPKQLALLLVALLGSLSLWYGLLEPLFRKVPLTAVRVPHARQVVTCDPNTSLRVGDTVFIAGKSTPLAGKIAALPLQCIKGHEANGPEQLVILGVGQYYVVAADGTGKVFNRAAIRGLVQTQT